MANIRKLKYEGQIVKQPIHDGKRLSKWIHDGVVVWQNGFADIYVVAIDGEVVCFWDLKNNNQISYIYRGRLGKTGITQDFVWSSARDTGYQIAISPTDEKIDIRSQSSHKSVSYEVASNHNRLITDLGEYQGSRYIHTLYGIEIDIEEKTYAETEIGNIEELAGKTFDSITIVGSITGMSAMGVPSDFVLCYGTKNVYIAGGERSITYDLMAINYDSSIKTLLTTYYDYNHQIGEQFSIDTQYPFRANSINYLIGTHTIRSASGSRATSFAIKEKEEEINLINNDINYHLNTRNIKDIRYDIENEKYLLYYYDTNDKSSHIYEVDENINFIAEIPLPDYTDVPITQKTSQYSSYTHYRIYFNQDGNISESGYRNVPAFDYFYRTTYFDEKGELGDNQTIQIHNNMAYGHGIVYIDNLYCQDSEGNWAAMT